jgi:hypothetical protein
MLLALLLVSPLVQGEYYTGNELLEMCNALIDETDVAKGNVCAGYLQGIVDAHGAFMGHGLCYSLQNHFCLSEGVSSQQLARIAMKYLKSHPEILHSDVAGWVIKAFIEAFPCN